MKRNKKRVLVAGLAICALAAGGAAFTANLGANFPSDVTAGFDQASVTGATSDGINYNLSADKQYITSVDLYFTSDTDLTLPGTKIQAAFGSSASNATTLVTCGAVTTDNAVDAHTGDYTTTCNFVGAPSPYTASGALVASSNYFNVSVTKDGTTGTATSHSTINGN
jgi:hypothetical protein